MTCNSNLNKGSEKSEDAVNAGSEGHISEPRLVLISGVPQKRHLLHLHDKLPFQSDGKRNFNNVARHNEYDGIGVRPKPAVGKNLRSL